MKIQNNISFGVIVGPDYQDYLRLFLKTAEKTSSIKKWNICLDSFCKEEDFAEFSQHNFITMKTKTQHISLRDTGHRHAEVIENFIDQAPDNLVCFFDCDIAFLKKGWDETMSSLMEDNIIAVGTEPCKDDSWRGFPNGFGMLLRKDLFNKIGATFKKKQYIIRVPRGTKGPRAEKIVTEENQHIWQRPIGHKIYCEIGIDFVEKSYENNYKGVAIPCIKKFGESQFFGFSENDILFSHCTNSRYGDFKSRHASDWVKYLKLNFEDIVS